MTGRLKTFVSAMASLSLLLLVVIGAAEAALYDRPKERAPLPGPMGYVSDHAQVFYTARWPLSPGRHTFEARLASRPGRCR